jgi:uncharacterized membrane protein (DUF373 family)
MEITAVKKMNIQTIFDKVLTYIINVIILFIIVILVIGLAKTLYATRTLLNAESLSFSLSHIVADILSFLVMVELFRSFIEYFKAGRIRLHSMIDPAIIFIVRELIVKLYMHQELSGSVLISFGVLLISLGLIRTMAILVSPEDEK